MKEDILSKQINWAFDLSQKALNSKARREKGILFKKSSRIYADILKTDPKNFSALMGLARTHLHSKRFGEAQRVYEMALKISKKEQRHRIYNGLANVSRYMADYLPEGEDLQKKAIKRYRLAIKSVPFKNSGLYWSNLSVAYASLRHWDKAIGAAKKAISILKKDDAPHGNQLNILFLEIKLYKEYKKRTLL